MDDFDEWLTSLETNLQITTPHLEKSNEDYDHDTVKTFHFHQLKSVFLNRLKSNHPTWKRQQIYNAADTVESQVVVDAFWVQPTQTLFYAPVQSISTWVVTVLNRQSDRHLWTIFWDNPQLIDQLVEFFSKGTHPSIVDVKPNPNLWSLLNHVYDVSTDSWQSHEEIKLNEGKWKLRKKIHDDSCSRAGGDTTTTSSSSSSSSCASIVVASQCVNFSLNTEIPPGCTASDVCGKYYENFVRPMRSLLTDWQMDSIQLSTKLGQFFKKMLFKQSSTVWIQSNCQETRKFIFWMIQRLSPKSLILITDVRRYDRSKFESSPTKDFVVYLLDGPESETSQSTLLECRQKWCKPGNSCFILISDIGALKHFRCSDTIVFQHGCKSASWPMDHKWGTILRWIACC